jgi:hypothetical protein
MGIGIVRALIVIACVLVSATARAKLGDDIAQCNTQYNGGKPGVAGAEDRTRPLLVGPGSTNVTYFTKGLQIRVGFKNGRAYVMEFMHPGTTKLTTKEIEDILQENGGGWAPIGPSAPERKSKWFVTYAKKADDGRVWVRGDKSAAYTFFHERALILVLNAFGK